jgi:hypothetical protein
MDAELRAATCVAAEPLRAEGQLEALAAGALADVIVLDGDPLEDIGCSQIQPRTCRWSSRPVPSPRAALTREPVQLPHPSSDIRG